MQPWESKFTAVTIAKILGVSVVTVHRWHREKKLSAYTPEALRDFLRTYTNWSGRLP